MCVHSVSLTQSQISDVGVPPTFPDGEPKAALFLEGMISLGDGRMGMAVSHPLC